MTTGERVAAYGFLFLASAAVLMWALTLPIAGAWAFGLGWGLFLREALDWIMG